VRLLDQIYHQAEKVVSWLGPEDETTSNLFVVIENLSTISPDLYNCVSMEDIWRPEIYASKLGILPLTQKHWLAWVAIMHRHYFTRVWIVQEIVLAKDIPFVCGSRVFSCSIMSAAVRFVVHSGWAILLHTEQMRVNQVLTEYAGVYSRLVESKLGPGQSAWGLFHATDAVRESGRMWHFASLLSNHRYCKSSDPRDMVYALQGVARKGHWPFDTQPKLLDIDYRISVQQFYTRTAEGLLRAWGDLEFLAQREEQSFTRIAGLPSWVPDYSVELMPQPLYKRGPNCNWCASSALKSRQDDRDLEDRLLEVQCMSVGAVEAMAADPTPLGEEDMHMFWAGVCEVANGLPLPYSLPEVQ
jgi:Heterokaryon incompatibility protein (HET)